MSVGLLFGRRKKRDYGNRYLADSILLSLELLLPWTYLRRVERIAIRDVNVKIKCSTCNKEETNHTGTSDVKDCLTTGQIGDQTTGTLYM